MSEEAPGWRRNVAAATLAAFIGFTGFTLVMPFLPIYIGELGETDLRSAALWAGLSLGITPAVTAAVSPAWGRIADRYGRRAMVVRSLASFVVVMSLMAHVTRPWHIFALRAVQGLFAGYGGLTIAMAAESAPRSRMPNAIGLVQMAQRLGPALGPVIGGLLAAAVGLRRVFYVTAGFYAAACVLVLVLYREREGERVRPEASAGGIGIARFWSLPNFALMLGAIFVLQAVDRSLGPILRSTSASGAWRPSGSPWCRACSSRSGRARPPSGTISAGGSWLIGRGDRSSSAARSCHRWPSA